MSPSQGLDGVSITPSRTKQLFFMLGNGGDNFNYGVRIERHAFYPLFYQKFRKVRIVRRRLSADADIFIFLFAFADDLRDDFFTASLFSLAI